MKRATIISISALAMVLVSPTIVSSTSLSGQSSDPVPAAAKISYKDGAKASDCFVSFMENVCVPRCKDLSRDTEHQQEIGGGGSPYHSCMSDCSLDAAAHCSGPCGPPEAPEPC